MKLGVVGLGYVGLIQAVGLAELGYDVIGVDIDEEKIAKINSKEPPIYEEGLKEVLEKVVGNGLKVTTSIGDLSDREVIFICVGTPSKKEGSMSLHQLESVIYDLKEVLTTYKIIVIKSTIVPGTCENFIIPLIERSTNKKFMKDFTVVMNPEFLREGNALYDFFNPDRIVIGSTDKNALRTVKEIYSHFECPILETNFREAEMIKYASNAFLATKISFINEIGNICKRLGINTNVVAKGIGMDKRISPHFLRAGIGFGGSCFPKDVNAIIYKATEEGYNPRLLRAVLEINKEQPLKLLELLEKKGKLRKMKIGILGLTFKAGTDDIRESPALNAIKELLMEEAELYIYDPKAMDKVKKIFPHLNYMNSAQEVVDVSDVILILTEWDEFRTVNYGDKPVIDGKNLFYDSPSLPKNYEGICW